MSSPTSQFKSINFSALSPLYDPILTFVHDYWKKKTALTIWTFVGKVMSLLFNTLSRFVIAFLPRSMCLNFMAAVTVCGDFGAQDNSLLLLPLFPHLFATKWWDWMSWSDHIWEVCVAMWDNLLRFIVTRYLWLAGVCALIFIQLLLLHSHFRHVRLCVTLWTAACQAPLSLGFSRQEC